MSDSREDQDISFEAAFAQLERIVLELERGNLDLAASLASYSRGIGLLARCQSLLDGVGQSVALLTGVDSDGNPLTTTFDASATMARPAPPAPLNPPAPAPEPAKSKPKAARKSQPLIPEARIIDDEFDPPF